MALNGVYTIEFFSFPNPPKRPSRPEAVGLRHLAFEVNDLEQTIHFLSSKNIGSEPIRIDETTNKRFTFVADPDSLPIEFMKNKPIFTCGKSIIHKEITKTIVISIFQFKSTFLSLNLQYSYK